MTHFQKRIPNAPSFIAEQRQKQMVRKRGNNPNTNINANEIVTEVKDLLTTRNLFKASLSGMYMLLAKRFISGEVKNLLSMEAFRVGLKQTIPSLLVEEINVLLGRFMPDLGLDPVIHESIMVGLVFILLNFLMGKKMTLTQGFLDFIYSGASYLAADFSVGLIGV